MGLLVYSVSSMFIYSPFAAISRCTLQSLTMVNNSNNLVPVTTNISSSTNVCSCSGHPPFTITITYECTASTTIWALYKHYSYHGNESEIRDPRRRYRRIGPSHRYIENEDDTEIDFTDLVRLEPGETLQKIYTFDIEDDSDRLYHNDISNLVVGNEYELGIRQQKWWWMHEKVLPPNLSTHEKKRFLYEHLATEWQPQETVDFVVKE